MQHVSIDLMTQAPRDHQASGLERAGAGGLLVIAALDDRGVEGKLADLGNVIGDDARGFR
jgi:hypothetical protein